MFGSFLNAYILLESVKHDIVRIVDLCYGSEKFENVQTFSMACIHNCAGCQSMYVLVTENCLNLAIPN